MPEIPPGHPVGQVPAIVQASHENKERYPIQQVQIHDATGVGPVGWCWVPIVGVKTDLSSEKTTLSSGMTH